VREKQKQKELNGGDALHVGTQKKSNPKVHLLSTCQTCTDENPSHVKGNKWKPQKKCLCRERNVSNGEICSVGKKWHPQAPSPQYLEDDTESNNLLSTAEPPRRDFFRSIFYLIERARAAWMGDVLCVWVVVMLLSGQRAGQLPMRGLQ
jgi:hypothetical protein